MTIQADIARAFSAHSSIHKADLATAVKAVESGGVTLDKVEALADAFETAASKGLVAGEVREAFAKQLARLVKAAPAASSQTLTRLNETQLRARLGKLETTIQAQTAEVAKLESEITATVARVEAKAAQASDLVDKKQKLQRVLREKKEQERNTLLFAVLLGAAGGAGMSAASRGLLTGMGLSSYMSIGDLEREIRKVDGEIASAQSEKRRLDASLQTFRGRQKSLRTQVDALKGIEAVLRGSIPDPIDLDGVPEGQRLAHLAQSVHANQQLSANLAKQINVLKQMRGEAGGFEAGLDALIQGLEAEVKELDERIVQTDRAILSNLFDIVVGMTGMDPNLRMGPFSVSKKMLLLDGIDGLKASLVKQAEKMLDKMVQQQLLSATGSKEVAKRLMQFLKGKADAGDVAETVRDVLTDRVMAGLSEPQRYLVDVLLTRGPEGVTRKELIKAVVANQGLSDAQARAVSAAFTGGRPEDVLKAMLGAQAASPTAAALLLLENGGALEAATALAEGTAAEAMLRAASLDDGRGREVELGAARAVLRTGAEAPRALAAQRLVGFLSSVKQDPAGFVDDFKGFYGAGTAALQAAAPKLTPKARAVVEQALRDAELSHDYGDANAILVQGARDALALLKGQASFDSVEAAVDDALALAPSDASVKAAWEQLPAGALDAKTFVDFVEAAAGDDDSRGSSVEFEELSLLVASRWGDLSERSKAAWRCYSEHATSQRAAGETGAASELYDDMRARAAYQTEDGARFIEAMRGRTDVDGARIAKFMATGLSSAGFAEVQAADLPMDESGKVALAIAAKHFAAGDLDASGLDAMLREMKAARYRDASMAEALAPLEEGRARIDAKTFIDALVAGGKDADGQGAGREFDDVEDFVARNGYRLTAGARRAFSVWADKVKTQRDAGETGLDTEGLAKKARLLGFGDESVAAALGPMLDHERKIEAKDLRGAILEGGKDSDGHARTLELEDVQDFAREVGARMSPGAVKVLAAYEAWAADEAQDWDALKVALGGI